MSKHYSFIYKIVLEIAGFEILRSSILLLYECMPKIIAESVKIRFERDLVL